MIVEKLVPQNALQCKKLSLQKALAAERFWREKLPMPKRESQALSGNCRFVWKLSLQILADEGPSGQARWSIASWSVASKMSLRRCRFKAVASLWLAFFSLQGRSLQDRSPPALLQATGRALGQHSGGSIPAVAFRRLCFCSSRAGLIACRAHRTSGSSRVDGHLWSGVHPATGRNRRLDVPLPSVSCFPRRPASLGVPLPTPLSGLSRVASGILRAFLRSLLCAPGFLAGGRKPLCRAD